MPVQSAERRRRDDDVPAGLQLPHADTHSNAGIRTPGATATSGGSRHEAVDADHRRRRLLGHCLPSMCMKGPRGVRLSEFLRDGGQRPDLQCVSRADLRAAYSVSQPAGSETRPARPSYDLPPVRVHCRSRPRRAQVEQGTWSTIRTCCSEPQRHQSDRLPCRAAAARSSIAASSATTSGPRRLETGGRANILWLDVPRTSTSADWNASPEKVCSEPVGHDPAEQVVP